MCRMKFMIIGVSLSFPLQHFAFPYITISTDSRPRVHSQVKELPSPRVEVKGNHLVVDGTPQPQLFGAEVQYFRLRGGYGPNVPRERVLALWNRALDFFVAAKMNAISFYIPWDFHEYAEGKFDFTGTADEDGDGVPDYPSRDLITFFKLIEEHGITRIMVRPGPYINAEWGFLGFGAIPLWFHQKYPNSHMRTPYGQRTRLYDYHNQDFLRHSTQWFKVLKEKVLEERMGPGKPIIFLQLDNETNYQWQSIYNHDFSLPSIKRYQSFLKNFYQDDIGKLNEAHHRKWERWSQIQPPLFQGRNNAEDQAWYQFADNTIYTYLTKIRRAWEGLGLWEPQVLFTLAESYNAPTHGILPHFVWRNAKDMTGLMTVNLYPKTYEEAEKPLLNFPFKADLDVKSADEANDSYFGSRQEWVMGPEIQGGWWKGIEISSESRQQTYLTVLGHGLKSFFIYYFNEGQNWDVEWAFYQIKPHYDQLRWERRLENTPVDQLPEDFWNELQARSDQKILVGFDVRSTMKLGPHHNDDLYFDSPLDGSAQPRNHYYQLQKIGEQVVHPYEDFLARALEVTDEIALVKDSTSHLPVADGYNISSVQAAADWTGGLLGYWMNVSINPSILHGELSPDSRFEQNKILTHLDTGVNHPRTIQMLEKAMTQGKTIINFLADGIAHDLKFSIPSQLLFSRQSNFLVSLTFYRDQAGLLQPSQRQGTKSMELLSSTPLYHYDLSSHPECEGILYFETKVVGYRCKRENGVFVQIGALIFEEYNSSTYVRLSSPLERQQFLQGLMHEAGVTPKMILSTGVTQTVAFARKDPENQLLWITVKTAKPVPQNFFLKMSPQLLQEAFKERCVKSSSSQVSYSIEDLLQNKTQQQIEKNLLEKGFPITLQPHGSAVLVLKPQCRSL